MPSPFETNCKTYELKTNESLMRSDCEMKCYIDLVIKECQLNCIFLWHNDKLIREQLSRLYHGLHMCDDEKLNVTTRECIKANQNSRVKTSVPKVVTKLYMTTKLRKRWGKCLTLNLESKSYMISDRIK